MNESTEPKYQNARGETTAEDPQRMLWYGPCGYWTDDWSKLSRTSPGSGIPCCPTCLAVGFQTTATKWFGGAAQFQRDGNPGYVNFLNSEKEKCGGRGPGLLERFKSWLKMHPNGRETNPRSDGT